MAKVRQGKFAGTTTFFGWKIEFRPDPDLGDAIAVIRGRKAGQFGLILCRWQIF